MYSFSASLDEYMQVPLTMQYTVGAVGTFQPGFIYDVGEVQLNKLCV